MTNREPFEVFHSLDAFARVSATAAGLLFLALTGCQSARVPDPLTRTLSGNDPGLQMEFLHRLAGRSVTCNDEAFHGLLLFLDGGDNAADYPARLAALRSRHLLPNHFDQPAEHAIERGTLAVALANALSIKGGLTMHVVGPSSRYAVRELQYLEIFPPSSPNQTFNGSEFLAVMSKAEDYQRDNTRLVRPTPPPEIRNLPATRAGDGSYKRGIPG